MDFSKYKKALLFIALFPLCLKQVHGQSQNYSILDNLNPVSPTAFQFVKYDQMPVSEYTGIPNISIPLYEIDEDGVKIPLELTYHAGGIRVNEEASWVGLGWDLQVGSIVQQVNDQDDLLDTVNRIRPDFYNTSEPIELLTKYEYCINPSTCYYGCTGPIPVDTLTKAIGFIIYTDMYAPYNGNYGLGIYQKDYGHFFDPHWYYSVDSEPDVFSANFAGHSFKFILDWSTGKFVVLDKKGYKITKSGNVLKVMVPEGDEYDFTAKNTVLSYSSTDGVTCFEGGSSEQQPSSVIWMLTQIITKNKKVITFTYNTPLNSYPVFPTQTQKRLIDSLMTSYRQYDPTEIASLCLRGNVCPQIAGPSPIGFDLSTRSYSQEHYVTLSSITFPKGQITFITDTNRNDLMGGAKLDSIAISSNQLVKSYKFNYNYFDATGVGGNTYNYYGTVNFGTHPLYRLKLLSLVDNSGATYTFSYNATQLPAKNSFAVDYWGFYNGDISDTTQVPNPAQFVNSTIGINMSHLGNNGDNHSANATYAQAGMLTQIKYPTGGSVNFSYELNQFNNYWVPDYSTSTNIISSGDGLRVQAITWLDASNNQLKKTTYQYSGGLAILPLSMFRTYNLTTITPGPIAYDQIPPGPIIYQINAMNEINMTGYFSSNPFASINGVGYSTVTEAQVDLSNITNGKTVSYFYNTPDMEFNSTVGMISQVDATVPAYKNPTALDNGTLQSQFIYDSSNNLLKKITNTYYNVNSPLYYGARLFGYGGLVTFPLDGEHNQNDQVVYSQAMVGYYPIFDFETLLSGSTETDYFGTDSLRDTTTNTYDAYNQISTTVKSNSTYDEHASFKYAYDYTPTSPILDTMVAHNRLADIVNAGTSNPNGGSNFKRTYQQIGNLIVAANDSDYAVVAYGTPNITTYDQHDPVNGNIFQYSKNTVPTSLLWDYNKEYVIAEAKNAAYTNIAYTSFEADGTGRWKFTGTPFPDSAAPTGTMVYSLSNGNIYRDSLATPGTYIVSYWSKNGVQTVNGSTTATQGYTFNGYTYFEHKIVNPASGTITVLGTGTIDELRLYPNTAQMKSYTYAPLVGVTSESNEGGKIAYYEYDNAMRLLDIRDQYKNILKAFCYNYAGQPTTCGLDITYSNKDTIVNYTRNNCSTGYIGSTVAYDVPMGRYTSTMSLQDANNQAVADANAHGQTYANANGICALPPSITTVQYAGHGTGYTEIIFSPITGCITTTINYTDITTGITYHDTGGCTSPRYETLIVGHDYQFTITCYSSAFPGVTSAPVNYHAYD